MNKDRWGSWPFFIKPMAVNQALPVETSHLSPCFSHSEGNEKGFELVHCQILGLMVCLWGGGGGGGGRVNKSYNRIHIC